jgi:hypothetical protein
VADPLAGGVGVTGRSRTATSRATIWRAEPLHHGHSALGATRTRNHLVRNQDLCPVEIRGQDWYSVSDSNRGRST